ncbi:unnamed protein product [Penicillium olsonii]|nr:unnamed protein product [Penicillium olsonii]
MHPRLELTSIPDPATGNIIAKCPDFDILDTKAAIEAAAKSFESFRTTTGRERSKLLRKWYEAIIAHAEDLAILITLENGKTINEARGEVQYAASFVEWFSEEAPRSYGDVIPSSNPLNRIVTLNEPVGVCGLITPWNFPAAMITRKIAPALAAGCTVVCKAPGEAPLTSLAIAELAHQSGFPRGSINIITALDNTAIVGEVLTTSPVIKKLSFTGSTAIGKLLMKQSSGTVKQLSLELGGNAPFLVFEDANLDSAIEGIVASKFRGSGQTCICANRIYVQRSIYQMFLDELVGRVRKFKIGNGFDVSTTHGPLIHDRAVAKVEAQIRDAEALGAKVVIGGKRALELGPNFFQPTVIRDMTSEMKLSSEETFGPVAALFPFDSEDEVVHLASQSKVGLAGYIFSRDVHRIFRVAERLEVGMIGVNTGMISDPASPVGGVKESGFGREGSKHGISEFQVVKTLTFGGMATSHL